MAKRFDDALLPGLHLSFTRTHNGEEIQVFVGYPYKIRCPTCEAAPGSRCTARNGLEKSPRSPHGWRIAAYAKRRKWVSFNGPRVKETA